MPVSLELFRSGETCERAWFIDGSSWTRRVRLPALVAIIRHPLLGAIQFDCGYGQPLLDSATIAARLYRRILPFTLGPPLPRCADRIFLSHFHPDHIGGLREAPSVPIIHSAKGLAELRAMTAYRQARSIFFPELLPGDFDSRSCALEQLAPVSFEPFGIAFDLAGDGDLLAVPLPGHAVGQYGLVCRLTGGRQVFLVADAAWVRSNISDPAIPPFPVRALVADYRAFVDTLLKLHHFQRRYPEMALIPSHCEESIGTFA